MRWLRAHPVFTTLLALTAAAGTVAAIAAAYGFGAFANAWSSVHFGWLALAVCGVLLAVGAYILAYRSVARVQGGPRLSRQLVTRVVIAGFGPFAPGGGFALDKLALHAIEDDAEAATLRVLGLGALEWALLAPAAWISAVVLLALGDHRPMASLLWPWAIAVPLGFVVGLWLATPARAERIASGDARWRETLGQALHGVGVLRSLAAGFLSCWSAWTGIALYWAFEIASFYGAARFIGMHLNLGELILGYSTGYALTRRSMPLGGAGVTEALMTFALHWVGQPVPLALAVVVVYRVFNFALPALPGLFMHKRVTPLVRAADDGETPAHEERRHAAAPLWQPGR